jgi:hypothetical protein
VLRKIPSRVMKNDDFAGLWESSAQSLDPITKERVGNIITRMHFAVVDHLVFTSATLLLALVPLVVLGLIELGRQKSLAVLRHWKSWPRLRREWTNPLDSAALTEGGTT